MPSPHPHLILLGFPASGKSTLARYLADQLGVHCFDTDALVENFFGGTLSCREIAQTHGLEFFRDLEKQVVLSLPTNPPGIIALGGGTLLDKDNLVYLQCLGTLVFLEVDRAILEERWKAGGLPSFVKDPSAFYNERLPHYLSIAASKIDLSNKTPEEAASEIYNHWNPHGQQLIR